MKHKLIKIMPDNAQRIEALRFEFIGANNQDISIQDVTNSLLRQAIEAGFKPRKGE